MKNSFKTFTFCLGILFFLTTSPAKAQEIYMNHNGTEKVGRSSALRFYDNGGPSLGPDYYWERWYSHNVNYTITFEPKVAGDKIKVTFNTFEAYSDNGGYNHAIGDWALRVNDDHLYIYEGAGTDDENLIADLTGSIRDGFSVMADGPITFHFVTNSRFREEGWDATVTAETDFTPQPPIILKDVCGTGISLFANPDYDIYYTTNGDEPTTSSTPYTGSFEIELSADPSNVTVKAIATYGITTTDVASVDFTHNDHVPNPNTPTISFSGNTVTMTTDAPPGYLNETYNIYYSTTGEVPWTLYSGPFEWTTPNTTFYAFTRAYSCEEKQSATVTETFGDVTVPNPVITFNNGTDEATITCSLPGAAIYYTTDGSTPTSSSTTYSSPFIVTLGTTVKAIAYHSGTGYANSGYSSVVSAIYTKGQSGGVSGNIVFLDDREDHSWSYYTTDSPEGLHSLNPADVKITYYGYGTGTVTTTNTAATGLTNSDFNGDVASSAVAVNHDAPENTFVYLKTLERANENGTGNLPYTMIPNPFQKRPGGGAGGASYPDTRPVYITTAYQTGTGLTTARGQLTVTCTYPDGTNEQLWYCEINTNGSGAPSTTLNVKVGATITFTLKYTGTGTVLNVSYTATYSDTNVQLSAKSCDGGFSSTVTDSQLITLDFNTTSNNFRGFYKWRVKSKSVGLTIKNKAGDYVDVNGMIDADEDIQFITANEYDNEVEFEALWAQAYVTTGTGNLGTTASGTNAYERNFHVVTSSTGASSYQKTYPLTVTSYYPNGLPAGGSVTGAFTAAADTKFENTAIGSATSSTWTANGKNLIIGRGVSGTVNYVRGISGDITAPNYHIRLESGTFNYVSLLKGYATGATAYTDNGSTISGLVNIKATIGNDYDRAVNETTGPNINNNMIFGYANTISSTENRTRKTLDMVMKSGQIGSSITINNSYTADAYQVLYVSVAGNHTNVGERSLTIEGGEISTIAGGIDGLNQATTTNDQGSPTAWSDSDIRSFTLRMKGGNVRGAVYGGAAKSPASGNRNMVFTGGTVKSWIGAGCNGTEDDGGQTYGKSFVYVGGDTHVGGGTIVNNSDPGAVFGAGKGYAGGSGTSGEMSYGTNLVIADDATIERNVYGGGNYGYALVNTNLYVLGGTVGGSVFGGSNQKQGPVVNINMKGGTIEGSLYGGSNSSGTISGKATTTMSGGTVEGSLFGGGKGSGTSMAAGTEVNFSGGEIAGNIYGGGEEGTVTGNTVVNVTGGEVNDVYGAGKGEATDAEVTGNATVTIDGAKVNGTVYGGGAEGKLTGNTTVNIKRGEVRGDVFGGALGKTNDIYVVGTHTVNVTGGHVFGNVYGGSKRANDALESSSPSDTEDRTLCITNISGGRIDRNVYGAGFFGKSYGSVYIFIGKDAIYYAPNHSATAGIDYPITNLRIVRSVWAGADWGSSGGFDENKVTITGYSNIYLDGTGYDVSSNSASNATYMNIGESLYACGNSSEAAEAEKRFIIIRNYGTLIDNTNGTEEPYAKASRTLYSIQRPTYLVFDNSHINLSGQGRINSNVSTEQYAIYEVSKALYLTNGSSLFFDSPVNQLKKLVSASCANVYNSTPNDGPEVDNYSVITTSTLAATPNKIRVGGGNYLKIHHQAGTTPTTGEPYGELSGFAYLMTSDDSDEIALIYARPKQCVPTHIESSNDNPNDGGWVAYKSDLNTFTLGEYSGSAWVTEPNIGGTDQVAYENHILVTKNGETHFRIWRSDGTASYREGVLNASANGTETFSTTDAVIPLPPFRKAGNYYRFQTVSSDATSIDYGSDVLTYNAASYGTDPSEANWMYCTAATPPSQVTGLASNNSNLEAAINLIKSMPDVNFGMVIIPSQGFSTATNYIICQESDGLLASSGTKFEDAQNGAEPQVTFRLTYFNTLKSNASYDPMTVVLEQVDPSNNKVVDRVTIVLGVNTITSIEETQSTDLYAIMRGTGSNTSPSDYTAKIVLPTFGIYDPETPSTFKVKSVTFVGANEGEEDPSNMGNLVARDGAINTKNNIAVTFNAAENSDHTNGWYSMTTGEKDAYSLLGNTSPSNYYTIGTADGRNRLAIDFHLYYDGSQTVTYSKGLMGTLTFDMELSNYKNSAGDLVNNQIMTIKVKVYRRGQGTCFYLDGVYGKHVNEGKNPNDAVLKLSTIYKRLGFAPGDVIYIVNTMTVGSELEWSGVDYNGLVTMYRYPGGHVLKDDGAGTPLPFEGNPTNAAFTGPLVNVASGGNLLINDITIDGHKTAHTINTSINPTGTDVAVTAQAPIITVEDGGLLSLDFDAVLQNNNNGSESVYGGGVNVGDGGTVMMNSDAKIEGNVSSEGGGIYMDGTLVVSDQVRIYDNYSSGTTQNNVLLTAPVKVVQIGTNTTDDNYGELSSSAKIGVTKSTEGHEGGRIKVTCVEEESDKDWLEVPYVRPNTVIVHDEGRYQLEKYTDNKLLYWLINTWVAVVTSNPNDPSPFDPTNIDTEEKLAWLISLVNGENSQTPNNFSGQTVTLTGDLDMSEYLWDPIGNSLNSTSFKGTFEGNGHTIEGLSSSLVRDNIGLFGTTEDATIQNLIVNADFSGTAGHIGTIAGIMEGGTIRNCEASGTITVSGNDQIIGGLVGEMNSTSSSSAIIQSSFSVTEMTGTASTIMGGLVGTNEGTSSKPSYLFNSYSNATMIGGGTMGGLVGVNKDYGWVENCYSIIGNQTFPAFAASNAEHGTIKICYTDKANGYVGSNSNTDMPAGHGTYGATLDRKEIGYMYDDNAVALESGQSSNNTNVSSAITYGNGHNITAWPGLLSALNNWVTTNPHSLTPAPTQWFRPTTKKINGDLPLLGFPQDNALATVDGKFLQYSAYDPANMASNYKVNGIDTLLTDFASETAYIFLYNNATNVTKVPSATEYVFINEDACLIQSSSAGAFTNTTVGITFDNSGKDKGNVSEYGDVLYYDWHLMSTSLSDAPIDAEYGAQSPLWGPVNITNISNNCYFPNGLTMGSGYDSGVKWDFYTYYEPQYHWINLKRSSDSHWHMDTEQPITYDNEDTFTPGKGYMMAISQDSYMCSTGTLNKGNVEITLTNQEPSIPGFPNGYNKGWNLVGNPYQAYLDLNRVGVGTYYIYDAESGMYTPYVYTGSENPVIPSRYIHPHQAFFMYTATDNKFTFTSSMATTTKQDGSYFRDDEQINYPLVDLFVSNEAGYNDLAIIEFNRPEIGGATKVNLMGNANFKLAAAYGGQTYGLLFAPEDAERIPVHFTTNEDGEYTLRWEPYNGLFTSLHLVDNLTGVNYDMLANDHYDFTASADDYASRFYITYKCVGIDEGGTSTGSFAYFDGSEWVIEGKGQLDVVDVLGRVLYSERLYNEQNRVNLNGFAPGVYLMRLTEGTETRVQKIINK